MNPFVFLLILLSSATTFAQALSDTALRKIAFDENLGASISLDTPFRDEQGKSVRLGDYFGKRPEILVLGYYRCPMLCTLVLNGLTSALQDIKPQMGHDYDVVDVSIDPHETFTLAAAKKKSYATRFGRPGVELGWHFLTGDEKAIRKLAAEVGFNYAYDPGSGQYAHPSGLIILAPSGKISHYLSGVVFSDADLSRALSDAVDAKVGSPIEQIFLLCFHYSPLTGKYSATVLGVVRATAVVVLLLLAAVITGAWRLKRAG